MAQLRRLPPPSDPPSSTTGRTKLNGPIYDLAEVKALLAAGCLLMLNRGANDKIEGLGWQYQHVRALIGLARTQDYRDSEWCELNGGNRYVDCDAYRIHVVGDDDCDPSVMRRAKYKNEGMQYYVKFGFPEPGKPLVCFVISCKPS